MTTQPAIPGMRRQDRAVTDPEAIYDILRHSDFGTLSLADADKPYAVPMSCGFFFEDGVPCLCWHSANAGTKLALLRKNPQIVYTCVSECRRDFKPERLHWSFYYKSACVSGRAEEVSDPAEKVRLLHLLLRHYQADGSFVFPAAVLSSLSVWKCRLDSISGKQHIDKA